MNKMKNTPDFEIATMLSVVMLKQSVVSFPTLKNKYVTSKRGNAEQMKKHSNIFRVLARKLK